MEENKNLNESKAPDTPESALISAENSETGAKKEKKTRRPLSRGVKAVILSVVLVLAVLATVLIVRLVRDRTPPELSEVRERYEALIRSSAEINTILFGEGLEVYPRVYEVRNPHKVMFGGEEHTIYYYTFTDEKVGDIVAYWYYVRIAEKASGGEGEPEGQAAEEIAPTYYYYDIKTGERVDPEEDGYFRYALKTTEQKEGDLLHRSGAYYYYALPEYADPVFFYTAKDDEGDGLYYDYCTPDCGYRSIEEIKEAAGEVYSAAYMSTIFENQFTGVMFSTAENGILYARYREYVENGYVYLQKCNQVKGYDLPDRRYDFDTMRIADGSKSKYVTIEIESYIAGDEENRTTVKLSFAKENDNWYLDSPSY